jgi:DNA-binding NtrC family response regulator
MVEDGLFRLDLLHRLGTRVRVEPLRARKEDILPLWELFLKGRTRGDAVACEEEVVEYLLDYDWPGNVRQLRNVAESAKALSRGGTITLETVIQLTREGGGNGASSLEKGTQNLRENDGLAEIRSRGRVGKAEYARLMRISGRTATRDLARLCQVGSLRRLGRGRSVSYVPVEKGP